MSQCDTQTGHCESTHQGSAHHEGGKSCCAVEKSLKNCGCPIDQAAEMWQKGFFCAMKEAQKEILKEKIRKAWGPVLEKEADAVLEAMGTHWQSVLAQAYAQKSLKENIAKIYQSMKK